MPEFLWQSHSIAASLLRLFTTVPSSHKTSQFWKYATSRSVNHHFLIIFSYLPIFFHISHPFSIIFPAFSHISMAIKRSSSPKQPVARWPWWRCSPCPAPTWAVAAASVGPPVAAGTGSCRWNRAMWCPGHGGYGAAEFTPGFKRRKKGGISEGFFMISWKLSWEFHGNFMDPMESGDPMVISWWFHGDQNEILTQPKRGQKAGWNHGWLEYDGWLLSTMFPIFLWIPGLASGE